MNSYKDFNYYYAPLFPSKNYDYFLSYHLAFEDLLKYVFSQLLNSVHF